MPSYITLTTTNQQPDQIALLAAVKAQTNDTSAVLVRLDQFRWGGKKTASWTPTQIAAAQAILDTTPVVTAQVAAQRRVDDFPIEYRALVLALIDGLNVVRGKLVPPLPPITPAQAIAAIRDKAGNG